MHGLFVPLYIVTLALRFVCAIYSNTDAFQGLYCHHHTCVLPDSEGELALSVQRTTCISLYSRWSPFDWASPNELVVPLRWLCTTESQYPSQTFHSRSMKSHSTPFSQKPTMAYRTWRVTLSSRLHRNAGDTLSRCRRWRWCHSSKTFSTTSEPSSATYSHTRSTPSTRLSATWFRHKWWGRSCSSLVCVCAHVRKLMTGSF